MGWQTKSARSFVSLFIHAVVKCGSITVVLEREGPSVPKSNYWRNLRVPFRFRNIERERQEVRGSERREAKGERHRAIPFPCDLKWCGWRCHRTIFIEFSEHFIIRLSLFVWRWHTQQRRGLWRMEVYSMIGLKGCIFEFIWGINSRSL